MDPYIILAKREQGAWIGTKEIGTSQWSLQNQTRTADPCTRRGF